MSLQPTPSARETECIEAFANRKGITAVQAEAFCSIAKGGDFSRDQMIYEEGAEGTDFILVAAGELEARRHTPFGEQKVATIGPGFFCGEISAIDGKPRSSSVIAISDGRLLRFDGSEMAALVAADLNVQLGLLRMFCRTLAVKIRHANQAMSQIMAPGQATDHNGAGSKGRVDEMDDEAKREILREQGMASEELQALSGYLEAQSFASGEPIFVEGESGDTLYIVADGRVRISRRIPGMGEEALAILGHGEVFGEMAWIDSGPRSADALAHTGGCTVLAISRHDLDRTIATSARSTADFLDLLCQVLCRRVRNMNDQVVAYRTMAGFG